MLAVRGFVVVASDHAAMSFSLASLSSPTFARIIFWSWVICGDLPLASETNNDCQVKFKLMHFRRAAGDPQGVSRPRALAARGAATGIYGNPVSNRPATGVPPHQLGRYRRQPGSAS